MSLKILLVDDEVNLVEPMSYTLKQKGFETEVALNGQQALDMYDSSEPDLILLDWSMPDLSGIDVLKRIRENQNFTPVIMVTGKSAKEDIVEGLEAGADDYITKPFNWEELLARVNSSIRRSQQPNASHPKRIRYGKVILDTKTHRAWVEDKELNLSPREYSILETFMQNPKRIYSRDELIEKVWGLDFDGDSKTVDVHICWLRQKIEEDPNKPKFIQTVRGFGYRLGS
jgi:two-component system, OmpR family, phosphate regulon response regulator PhoB